MTTREYLNQINKINLVIEAKVEDEIRLRALATKVTVPTDGERVKSSSDPDRMTNIVAKIIELDKELEETLNIWIEKRKIIIEQIDSIENPTYYHFLDLKYVKGMSRKEIQSKMAVSKSAIFNIQKEALIEFELKFGYKYLTPDDLREEEMEIYSKNWKNDVIVD